MAKVPIHRQLNALQQVERHLTVKKQILLEKALYSTNPSDVIKASEIASANIEPRQEEATRKSYLIDPLQFSQFMGYKNKPYALSYQMLKRISYSVPIIRAIINTRLDQITSFCEPQKDKYSTGFIVRKKQGFYSRNDKEPSKQELQRAEDITNFILNCGIGNNFDSDDFDSLTRKVFNDSYMYDQLTFEVVRNKKGIPINYYAVDASTVRIADSFDPDAYDSLNQNAQYNNREKVKGYYPTYCQIENGTISADFYPWEMCLGVRNPVTDIAANGYGVCEIEILINIVTSMLWSDEYNRRFFSQGSAPKGFLKIKSGSMINSGKLGEFKQAWQGMMQGVTNSHKTPVLEGDVEWIDLQHSNRDMEFSNWQEYLIKLACAIYRIDPAEINFPLSGSSDSKPMFEGNNEARLKHSKDKGLYPALKFWQRKLNKYLVSQIDPEYELVFVGMDGVDVDSELEQDIKMVTNFMTVDEIRIKRGLKPIGEAKGGNLILNAAYMQKLTMDNQAEMMKQQQQMQGQPGGKPGEDDGDVAEQEEDGFSGGEPDTDDPFEKAFNSYLETLNKAA